MRRLLDVTLETKINGILISIITLVVMSVSAFVLYDSVQEYNNNAERLSLQSAKTISFLPFLVNSGEEYDRESIQAIANQYIFDNDIDFVIIKDGADTIITHPDSTMIGQKEIVEEDLRAKTFGAYYTYDTDDYEEPAVVSVAPIYSEGEYKQISGIVKAGYYKSSVHSSILSKLYTLFTIVLVFILISFMISKLFSMYIKSETLGYEPKQITTILKNRENIFSSLGEGIIAVDKEGYITYLNKAAKDFLNIQYDAEVRKRHINNVFSKRMVRNLQNDEPYEKYYEIKLNDKDIVVLVNQLFEKGDSVGRVLILRNMTKMAELTNKLTIVESLFDDLRAQSHEYKNKLHLMSGLLEMGKYNQIREIISEEDHLLNYYDDTLVNIKENRIQALLVAKLNKAGEKRVKFQISPDSYLENSISDTKMLNSIIIIMSNLIDNAMEAVNKTEYPEVIFYMGHFEGWLEISVEDNGPGFEDKDKIFEKGFTTKSESDKERGYGLYNVMTNIRILEGFLDVSRNNGRTCITVEIPYEVEGL